MVTLRVLAAVTLLLVPAAASAQQSDPATRVAAVFSQWASDESAGCAAAIDRDGRVVLADAWGMADLEQGIANSPHTIFEAGSVSKQFTAAAVILLALDGALGLEDDVREYVPELPDYGSRITIRHLLTHTSGLRDWGSVAAIAGWPRGARTHTHDHVLDILSRQRALNFEPGTEYSYSNSGYNLLAIIVSRVSGMPFAEFSRRRIFEPLELENTQWRDDYRRLVRGRSSAYAMRDSAWVIDRPIENVHGNGGLLTTVGDLLRWNHALANGTIGGSEFVRMMHERGVLNNGSRIDYASGIVVGELDNVPEISHTGATSGYRAFLARYPEQRVGVAVLCNAGNVDPGRAGRSIARIMIPNGVSGALASSVAPEEGTGRGDAGRYTPDVDALQSLAGEYYSPDADATFTIEVRDGVAVLHRGPGMQSVLSPLEADLFSGGAFGRIRFGRDEDGAVSHLSVQQARVYDLRFDRVSR